jgi:hypothetical protein
VEFRKEEKRNAYRMLMEKPLVSTAWKTEINMRRCQFEIYLREPTVRKKDGKEESQLDATITVY